MANKKRLPPVDQSLIDFLVAKYPNAVPDLEASDRQVWAAVGRQQVITFLKGIANKTVKDNLGIS